MIISANPPIPKTCAPSAAALQPEKAKEDLTVSTDKDTRGQGSDSAHLTKMCVQGGTALTLASLFSYAGLAGGAMVGGLLGGALGPAVNALNPLSLGDAFGHGNPFVAVANGLGAAWQGAGTVGHIGMALGTMTALAGSLSVGAKIGRGVGRVCGIPKETESKAPINWKNWGTRGVGAVLMPAGVAAGVVGGFALAGGAAAAGSLLQGVFHHGLHAAALNGVGPTMGLYGAGGAILSGGIGYAGGAALTTATARHLIDPLSRGLSRQVDEIRQRTAGVDQTPENSASQVRRNTAMKGAIHGALALGGSALLGQLYPGWTGAGAGALLLGLGGAAISTAATAAHPSSNSDGSTEIFGSTVLGAAVGLGAGWAGNLGPAAVALAALAGAGVGALGAERAQGSGCLPLASKNTLKSVAQGAALVGGSALLGQLYGWGGIAAAAGLSGVSGGLATSAVGGKFESDLGFGCVSASIGALSAGAGHLLGPGYLAAAAVLGGGAGAILANTDLVGKS